MEDTWASRDLPVLDAVVRLLDEPGRGPLPLFGEAVAEHTGTDAGAVESALHALSPDYVRLRQLGAEEGGLETLCLEGVTAEARRAVGQWPTGENLIEQLAAGLRDAAEQQTDPEQKRQLLMVARELGGAVKAIAINVASQMLEHRLPH
jgi:hypothetical protein